jgi:hypothetical protein
MADTIVVQCRDCDCDIDWLPGSGGPKLCVECMAKSFAEDSAELAAEEVRFAKKART